MRGTLLARTRHASAAQASLIDRSNGLFAGDAPGAVARAAFAAVDASARLVETPAALPVSHATRPLRFGLLAPGRWADLLMNAKGVLACEWLVVSGAHNDADLWRTVRSLAIDALISRDDSGNYVVWTQEAIDRPAWCDDWAEARPVSYATVFPVRLDCSRVTIPGQVVVGGATRMPEPTLVRLLVEAAALFSRVPARLDKDQINRGRTPVFAPIPQTIPVEARDADANRLRECARAVEALREAIFKACLAAGDTVWTGLAQVAARVAGAWASVDAPGADLGTRLEVLEWCAAALPDDPETLLRLGAARIAAIDDIAGFNAMDRAASRLLALTEPPVEASGFIQAELERGVERDDVRLGRVAAGVCMLACSCHESHLQHVIEDLREDMAKSEMLVGMDQDRRVLEEIFDRVRFVRVGATMKPATADPQVDAFSAEAAELNATATENARKSPKKKAKPAKATAKLAPKSVKPRARKPAPKADPIKLTAAMPANAKPANAKPVSSKPASSKQMKKPRRTAA
jgi:hypothetical protein